MKSLTKPLLICILFFSCSQSKKESEKEAEGIKVVNEIYSNGLWLETGESPYNPRAFSIIGFNREKWIFKLYAFGKDQGDPIIFTGDILQRYNQLDDELIILLSKSDNSDNTITLIFDLDAEDKGFTNKVVLLFKNEENIPEFRGTYIGKTVVKKLKDL